MTLTEPQLWALAMIQKHEVKAPAQLGELMMKRPGIEASMKHPGYKHHKAQAMGRLGGVMAARLDRLKLISWGWNVVRGHSFRTAYKLTPAGRSYLAERSIYVAEWTEGA